MKILIIPVLGLKNTIIWINIVFSSIKKVTYTAAAKLKLNKTRWEKNST